MKEKDFKKALMEAAAWEFQLTEEERTEIIYSEAREKVVDRILEKYKHLL